jgi:hypothetical protein
MALVRRVFSMNEQTTDELLKNVLAALAVIIMTRPLALTDHQLAEVQRAARTLPPSQREHFLEALAHRLGAEPSDEALAQAIRRATGN